MEQAPCLEASKQNVEMIPILVMRDIGSGSDPDTDITDSFITPITRAEEMKIVSLTS